MAKTHRPLLTRFLVWSARMAGKPTSFIFALAILVIWLVIGLFFGFTTQWLLIIDTLATINASLMVFIIQNTQYRESKALHLKIDELIRVNRETEQELIAIEEREEEELERLKQKLNKKKASKPKSL